MTWNALIKRLMKLPVYITKYQKICVVLENPQTGETERIPLALKFDAKGHPYFIRKVGD